MKKIVPDNTTVLDLNTTAKRNDKVIDKFSPYMNHMTYFVMKANLAYPIGQFNEQRALAEALGRPQSSAQEERPKNATPNISDHQQSRLGSAASHLLDPKATG